DQEPFVTPSGGRMDEIIRAVRDCPSGALSYAIDGHEARTQVDHGERRDPAIEVSKDGPYRVTGAVPLLDARGGDQRRHPRPSTPGAPRGGATTPRRASIPRSAGAAIPRTSRSVRGCTGTSPSRTRSLTRITSRRSSNGAAASRR